MTDRATLIKRLADTQVTAALRTAVRNQIEADFSGGTRRAMFPPAALLAA
jgi:hypothetical protein